jgi:hypothetical protein
MSKVEVTGESFRAAYLESHKAGENIHQFAERVGLKSGSAIARLSNIRSSLRDQGLTDEQVANLFPSLTRVAGSGRKRQKDSFIASLVAEAKGVETAPQA